jgi:hypothetical protein
LNIFGLHNAPPEPRFDASPKKSAVASILSMVDIADTSADDPKAPHTALSGLLTSLSESKGSIKDKKECAAYLEAGNAMFNLQLSALQAQPFFAMKRASWECLMRCVKAIGRKKEIRLSVFSAPPDAGDEVFEILSAVVGSSDVPPDIILWDYPILFTNAEMTRLTRLTGVADRLKSAVIAPLSPADQLFENIDKRHDFSPLFEDIRFLPFKKLRSSLPSRALCLCAPDMTIPDAAIGRDTPRVRVSFRAHCCWPMILRWIEKSLCDIDPFALDSSGNAADTMLPENAQFDQNIPQSFCQEAASVAGITLYNGTPFEATIPKARTVIDPEVAGSAYSSFAFNLLVNRVARLAGLRIVQNASSMKGNELARDIEGFLAKELISYRVCTAPDQVSVKSGQDGSLDISLNSEVMVGGFPARFSFSLEA